MSPEGEKEDEVPLLYVEKYHFTGELSYIRIQR